MLHLACGIDQRHLQGSDEFDKPHLRACLVFEPRGQQIDAALVLLAPREKFFLSARHFIHLIRKLRAGSAQDKHR